MSEDKIKIEEISDDDLTNLLHKDDRGGWWLGDITDEIDRRFELNFEQIVENKKLKERLAISPYGDDKIDELEEAIGNLRHTITTMKADVAQKDREITELRRKRIGDSEIIGRWMCQSEKLDHELSKWKIKYINLFNGAFKRTELLTRLIEIYDNKLAESKSKTWCAYCGFEIAIDDDAATKIGEHIKECTKHPIRAYERHNAELEAELAAAREQIP